MTDDNAPANTRLSPCRYCGIATEYATLTSYGARCGTCFQHYCLEKVKRPNVPDGAIPVGKKHARAWAYRLQWREEQGEAISANQRAAWREVLHTRAQSDIEAPEVL